MHAGMKAMKYSAVFCKNNKKIFILFTIAVLLLFTAAAFGLMLGSTQIKFTDIFSALKNGPVNSAGKIIIFVRLPRTLGSIFTGAALAVAGAVIQNVLANRLASPSIIGVNAGAGLAVTLCTVLGLYGGWQMSAFSFLGAFLTVILISFGAQKLGASRGTVILMGVAVNSLLNAFSDAIITFNPNLAVMSTDFKIGDFSAVTYQKLIPAMIIIAIALLITFTLSNELDVLTLGEENARGLGMNTKLVRTVFFILAAMLSGCGVSIAGLLSFVGLIVPHIVRMLGGRKSAHLLPLSALFGGSFVCLCDTIARTLFAPYEIPVGIIMAFLGAPFFFFILIKGKGGHKNA